MPELNNSYIIGLNQIRLNQKVQWKYFNDTVMKDLDAKMPIKFYMYIDLLGNVLQEFDSSTANQSTADIYKGN